MRIISILALFLLSTSAAFSAGLCLKLFESTPKISTDPRDYLSKEKLAAEGLDLMAGPKGDILLVDTQQAGKILGKIAVKPADYLYQWAPLDYQQSYIENDGIDKGLMQEIINERAQSYGKGFYVSTNPYDSADYGDALTIFKTSSPLITIQNYSQNSDQVAEFSTKLIHKLRRIGIDAIQTPYQTWLSVINHNQLVSGRNITVQDQVWSQKYLKYQMLNIANYKSSQSYRWLPADHIIRRILNRKLTPQDVASLRKLKKYSLDWNDNRYIKPDKHLIDHLVSTEEEDFQRSMNLINKALSAVGEAPLDL